MLFGNLRNDRVLQTVQAILGETADPQRVDVPPIRMFRQIALVQQHDPDLLGRVLTKSTRFLNATIQHLEEKIGARQRLFGARDSGALDLVRGFAQTGGIEQANRNAAQVDYFLDRVAGGAGLFADNGTFVTKQAIEQTRLAGVGRAVNNSAQSLTQNASLIGGREQGAHLFANRIEPSAKAGAFIDRKSVV